MRIGEVACRREASYSGDESSLFFLSIFTPRMRPFPLFLTAFVLSACSAQNSPPDCPGPHPAFRLQISSEGGQELPMNTTLTIKYGGNGEESFRLGAPHSPQALFCSIVSTEDHPGTSSFTCELWTDGAAQVKVEAGGFQAYEKQLSAATDECGIVTTLMEIQLKPISNAKDTR